jgi:hypothetical protein
MPGDYHYLDDSDVYVTVYWGRLSLFDILETISHRAEDPDLREAKVHVIDLSNATWTETPPVLVQEQAEKLRPAFAPPKMPTILVAASEFFFGFARMYAVFQVIYGGSKVHVVRSWVDAREQSVAPLDSAEAWARERAAAGAREG